MKNYKTYTYTHSRLLQTILAGAAGGCFLFYLFYQNSWLCLLGALIGGVGYVIYRRRVLAEAVLWQLMIEFKDVMDSMISALVAGYSMENAITEAYHDLQLLGNDNSIMRDELHTMMQKLKLKHSLDDLLLDLGHRSGLEDIITFAQIYATARRSGGNLVRVMKRTANNINEKMEMKREIQTMIAGKKMESACMMAIPLFIILYLKICSPGFLDPLYSNLSGRIFMTVAFVVYIVAVIWSRKIMKISY